MARIEYSSCMGLLRQSKHQLDVALQTICSQKAERHLQGGQGSDIVRAFVHSRRGDAAHRQAHGRGDGRETASEDLRKALESWHCRRLLVARSRKQGCVLPFVLRGESRGGRPFLSLIVRTCEAPFVPVFVFPKRNRCIKTKRDNDRQRRYGAESTCVLNGVT